MTFFFLRKEEQKLIFASEDFLQTKKKNRIFTCETHESSFSGLLPQSLHIFVVNVNQVDGLQPKCFGRHNHLLSRVQELFGISCPCGT